MLSVVRLNVIMLSVVASFLLILQNYSFKLKGSEAKRRQFIQLNDQNIFDNIIDL
jgi:hypothetical protein